MPDSDFDGPGRRVIVRSTPPGCSWRVTGAGGVAMTGQAETELAAYRCGVLAAAALDSLRRIARRRF